MITINSEELDRYVVACIETANIYSREYHLSSTDPIIIDSLRGAHPIVQLVNDVLVNYSINPRIYPLPTSGFLKDRVKLLHDFLLRLFREETTNGNGNFFFIDTMISGSSLRNFKRNLKRLLYKQIAGEVQGKHIDFTIVGIKQDGVYKPHFYEQIIKFGFNTFHLKHYFLNMGKIITEDVPELLGIDYPYIVAHGIKLPLYTRVEAKEDITLDNKLVPVNDSTTSELFLSLAREWINYYLIDS